MGMSYIRYRRNGRRACGNSGRPAARGWAKMLKSDPPVCGHAGAKKTARSRFESEPWKVGVKCLSRFISARPTRFADSGWRFVEPRCPTAREFELASG